MSRTRTRRWALLLPVLLSAGALIGAVGAAPASARAGSAKAAVRAAAQPLPNGLGGKVWDAIPTKVKVVALTFDAGANADGLPSILSTLQHEQIRASFFLTGNFVSAYPAASKSIANAGYRIGDHSISHPYFTQLTDQQMRDQVLGAQASIKSATGQDPWPWFRFPYGDYNAHAVSVVNSVGFVPVGWTVDTLGWEGTSGGQSVQTVVNRVLANLKPGEIVLMHCGSNPTDHSTLDAAALPTVIKELRARGYGFVSLDAFRGLGYHILASTGGIHSFGPPWYGSDRGMLPAGVSPVGVAANQASGGYWILRSNGGIGNHNVPWYGSLNGKLAGKRVVAITAAGNGYAILTSDGGVHVFGTVWHGSDRGKLPAGVRPVGIAADPATGGYWILRSNGGVSNQGVPFYGSLRGILPAGVTVTGITATKTGYLILTSDGGVHDFNTTWYGSDRTKLPTGVRPVAIAADPATGGYWILRSDGVVSAYNAPSYGTFANGVPAGQSVVGIAGL